MISARGHTRRSGMLLHFIITGGGILWRPFPTLFLLFLAVLRLSPGASPAGVPTGVHEGYDDTTVL